MSGPDLIAAIQALIASHPLLGPSPQGHAKHAERYLAGNGAPIGFEPRGKLHHNIWVRADAVRLSRLSGIESKYYDRSTFHISKPNHDLFGEPAFKDADLIQLKIKDLWQAARVILEVAGAS